MFRDDPLFDEALDEALAEIENYITVEEHMRGWLKVIRRASSGSKLQKSDLPDLLHHSSHLS
jgi:hypothetical protein